MDFQAFDREIASRELRPAYLLCGTEEYAKKSMLEKLVGTLEPAFRDFNYSVLEDPEASALLASCEQLPLMEERRIVVVKDSRFLQEQRAGEAKASAEPEDGVLAYLKQPNLQTVLVFYKRGECDKRRKIYKAIDKAGGVVNFGPLEPRALIPWLAQQAGRLGSVLKDREAAMLVDRVGSDMNALLNELQKVCAHAGGAPVSAADITACVVPNLEYNSLRILDEFVEGRVKSGLEILDSVLESEGKDAAYKLAGFLASRLRTMLSARRALDCGSTPESAAASLSGAPYANKKAVAAARRMTAERIEEGILRLNAIDLRMKSETVDARLLLETALLSFRPLKPAAKGR